jgi:signal transduction histidine kinase/ligand-binding sensor domain-containing protein
MSKIVAVDLNYRTEVSIRFLCTKTLFVNKIHALMARTYTTTRSLIARSALFAGILLACCPCVSALNPALEVSQYAHTSWKIRDGFSKGRIGQIAQTPDGYLWLGTEFGLLRFDGVRNALFEPPANQHLPSNTIFDLLTARDGTLWIGTDNGLASWKDGKLTQYPEFAGHWVFALTQDRDELIWVGTSSPSTGKLCSIHDGSVKCYGEDGSLGKGVFDLLEDSKGNLWAESLDGLWRWKPGPPEFLTLPGSAPGPHSLAEDVDGALLTVVNGELKRLVNGKPEAYSLAGSPGRLGAHSLFRDRDGNLWIGGSNGLIHIRQGKADIFSTSNGLSGDNVTTFFEDREGNLWVTTTDGLDRFRDLAVYTFSLNQGLSNAFVGSVLATRDGTVLLATLKSLDQWKQGQITTYGEGSTRKNAADNTAPLSIYQDHLGQIWAVTRHEFGYLDDARFISIKGIPGGVARSIVEDGAGDLWVAHQDFGLFQLQDKKVVQQIPWVNLGHKDFPASMAFDPLQGGLWIGFFQGGIVHFRDGKVQASYGVAEGLGGGRVTDLRFDQDGNLWAATAGGLSRLKNNHISTLTTANGLPCNTIHWTIQDNEHFVWMYTTCGLARVAQEELLGWASTTDQNKDPHRTISVTLFDTSEGVRNTTYTSGYHPQVAKTTDGRIWFLPGDGVSVVDPRHLPFNKLPPPVHIEQITADRKPYHVTTENNGHLRLPPLSRDLEIDYTALSLVAPEKIRFRYKLEGYDRDWQDAGNRRLAIYTNLPPRNYRFRVMACNNSGVWNETGTFLDFSIAPAYYQTNWFRILISVVFLLVLGVVYQLRVRHVARQVRGRMEERLEERERIARDLHDTLLQSVQGLILQFHAVSKQIPSDASARAALEKTLDNADQVLAEGRDRIRNLRVNAASLTDLPASFRSVAEETPRGREATFKTVVEGHVRDLHPLVLEECYSIGREAIVNALSHSQGQHIEAEIIYDPRQFRLRVRDDGRGIDPKILEDGERPGHWGLQGMRERAQRVGGQLRIWSRPETGTELELTIPGATAYQGSSARTKKFWFNLFSKAGGNSNEGN